MNIAEVTMPTILGKTPVPTIILNGEDVTSRTVEVTMACNGYRARLFTTSPPTMNELGAIETIEITLHSLTVKHE